eukprot:6404471-Karenia_brevis.AAC.1
MAMSIKTSPTFALESNDSFVPPCVLHTTPPHVGNKPFITLRYKATKRMTTQFLHHLPHAITGLFRLLSCFRIASSGDTSGISWMELYFLAVALSPTPMLDFRTDRAQSRRTIAQLLREFMTASMKFVRFLLPRHYQALFLASFAPPNRL